MSDLPKRHDDLPVPADEPKHARSSLPSLSELRRVEFRSEHVKRAILGGPATSEREYVGRSGRRLVNRSEIVTHTPACYFKVEVEQGEARLVVDRARYHGYSFMTVGAIAVFASLLVSIAYWSGRMSLWGVVALLAFAIPLAAVPMTLLWLAGTKTTQSPVIWFDREAGVHRCKAVECAPGEAFVIVTVVSHGGQLLQTEDVGIGVEKTDQSLVLAWRMNLMYLPDRSKRAIREYCELWNLRCIEERVVVDGPFFS